MNDQPPDRGYEHAAFRHDAPARDAPRDEPSVTRPAVVEEQPALTRPPRRARRWPWIVLLLIVIGAAAGAYWFFFGQQKSEEQTKARGKGDPNARAMPVVAAPARKGELDVFIDALGTVVPRNMVVVRSRVDGQLLSVSFTEGQQIKAGALLAQIDARPFEVQLTQAMGQMAKDQAQLKNAQVDLERYRTLLAQDSISKQQVDTQEALVRQYQGTIQADQGAIDSAKLQITYSRITAPISGTAGLRQVDPGNIVHASDSNGIVTIAEVQPVSVISPVPEDNVPRIKKRMQTSAQVPVDAFDRGGKVKLATGRLLTIDNQIDTTTGTVKIKSEFPNQDSALFPNQFVNVRMAVETRSDVTLVPSAAIQRGAPGTFVFVVKDDHTVAVTPVKTGAVQGETTEVQSGIEAGNLVVVDGADKLRDGSKVELIDPNARAAQQAAPPGAEKGKGKGEGKGEWKGRRKAKEGGGGGGE